MPPPFDGEVPELVSRADSLRVRSINETKRTVDFVASTDTIDSYGDRVAQNWRLERFLANPVVLFGHNSRELPIGRATRVEVVNGQLECTIQFAEATLNAKAEEVFRMIVAEFLRAVSVGFLPHSYRWEKEGDRDVFVLDDNELYEISVVPIPANPDSLAKMKSRARQGSDAAERGSETGPSGRAKNAPPEQKDTTMNEKELREALQKTEVELASAKKEVEVASTRAKALEAQNDALVKERDAANAKAKELETKAIETEVEALVGKKITPAEKGMFVELATSNRVLFTKMVEQRSDLTQTAGNGGSVLPTAPEVKAATPANASDVSDIAGDFF